MTAQCSIHCRLLTRTFLVETLTTIEIRKYWRRRERREWRIYSENRMWKIGILCRHTECRF